MAFEDKNLTCSDCGTEFVFSASEQELYKTRGYNNEPKRCPSCRASRKTRLGSSNSYGGENYGAPRQMHQVVCAQCGKETEVPFVPRGDRPVYCSDCYRKIRTPR